MVLVVAKQENLSVVVEGRGLHEFKLLQMMSRYHVITRYHVIA